MAGWQEFTGLNRGYVLELYEKYRNDPASVDAETRAMFEQWTPPAESAPSHGMDSPTRRSSARRAWRSRFAATDISPQGSIRSACASPIGDPSLLPETHNVTEEDLRQPAADAACRHRWPSAPRTCSRSIEAFRALYCSTTGYDYNHVFVPEERRWLRQAAEGGRFRAPARSDQPGRAARAADARSRPSSDSSTAHFRARRASRSKGSTCSCRSSTR